MKSYLCIAAISGLVLTHGQTAGTATAGAGSGIGAGTGAGAAGRGTIGAPAAPAPLTPSVSAPGIALPRTQASSAVSTPGNVGGTAPAISGINGQGIAFNSLPTQVQNSLRAQSGNLPLGTVTQFQTPNGPVYMTTITRNGQLVPVAVHPNGTLMNPNTIPALQQNTAVRTTTPTGGSVDPNTGLNNVPVANSPGTLPGSASASGVATTQAGIPATALPASIQTAIRSQLPNATIQTISRDETQSGSLYRVTVNQNGVPTELRFAPNGTLLGSTVLTDSATAPIAATVPAAAVVVGEDSNRGNQAQGVPAQRQTGNNLNSTPGQINVITNQLPVINRGATNRSETIRVSDLPEAVAAVMEDNVSAKDVRQVRRDQRDGEDRYFLAFIENGQYGELEIAASGEVIRDSRKTGDVKVSIIGRAPIEDKRHILDYNVLPAAVRNAVQAYAEPGQVRSARLTKDKDGATVYEVVVYADGKRDRLVVSKEGVLTRYEDNAPISAEATTVDKTPVLAIGDLPREVQDTIRRQTDTVRIEEIRSTTINGNTVFQVAWQTNGTPAELLVAADGAVIYPAGAILTEAAGEDRLNPVPDSEEPEVVQKLEVKSESVGRAAGSVTGRSNSTVVLPESDEIQLTSVRLEETPEPVQETIRKLGGSTVIESISPRVADTGVVYKVSYKVDGVRKTMTLDKEGVEFAEK